MAIFDTHYKNIIQIAMNAGQIIRDIKHKQTLDVQIKSDSSPVTLADFASHSYITNALQNAYSDISVISEETDTLTTPISDSFFLVDPLDGTRDFIDGTNDYCVNIALIKDQRPVLGVIYIPETHQCYYALEDQGSFKIPNCDILDVRTRLHVKPETADKTQTISKRSNPQSYTYFDFIPNITHTIRAGSAIKFCQIAEGVADIYPRPGNTGEWDTAAGELIVVEAGGIVRDKNHKPIIYGKEKKNYLNDAFYAANCILSA